MIKCNRIDSIEDGAGGRKEKMCSQRVKFLINNIGKT